MQTVTLELPDAVDLGEVRLMIFASLFGKGTISSGKAAALLGMKRTDFLLAVGQYGISVFSDDEDDLKRATKIRL
ncbi:putative HTH domain antitoxin [Lewinella aquimaris]|uniref:Putative HTH domain antitoxin n=1 Tax=Neolewinella aquimaris TaxID=1835722 RepID=A0A840EBQ4_9BACT|nr:UPF0175 family protein [Neolewinella aquimaris]MBB4081132.1 putative HTH domain antitoxin [Neolewinella aquimaris]